MQAVKRVPMRNTSSHVGPVSCVVDGALVVKKAVADGLCTGVSGYSKTVAGNSYLDTVSRRLEDVSRQAETMVDNAKAKCGILAFKL